MLIDVDRLLWKACAEVNRDGKRHVEAGRFLERYEVVRFWKRRLC